MPTEDTRPQVAVYGIVSSQRDGIAQGLAVQWAIRGGYKPIEYVDKAAPREGKASAWDRLLEDIGKGLFYGVVMWQESKGMLDYCSQYNTRFAFLDNVFAMVGHTPVGRKASLT